MQKEEWPENEIDHIDGNKDNNRIDNLRSVTSKQNARNRKLKTGNRTGYSGVYTNKQGTWRVCMYDERGRHISRTLET